MDIQATAPNILQIDHDWYLREVQHDGATYFHRHCRRCGRDLVRAANSGSWFAAYIGVFRFEELDDATTQRWLSEPCPNQILFAETNELRQAMRR